MRHRLSNGSRSTDGDAPATREVLRARDAMLRRTRVMIAGAAAGAVGLSGMLSVVAAQAFKGHTRTVPSRARPTRRATRHIHVPRPQSVPAIADRPAPLQPPAQSPAPSAPAPAPTAAPTVSAPPAPAPAPATAPPQVSGGS